MRRDVPGSRWSRIWPLALLCCGLASRWMLSDARPQSASTVSSLALGSVLAAAFCVASTLGSRAPRPVRRSALRDSIAGALLLAGPEIELLFGTGDVQATDVVIALALTPVCLAIAESALGGDGQNLTGKLWPGLVSVAALLLILPQPSVAGFTNDAVLFAGPVLTGLGAALFVSSEPLEKSFAWRSTFALLGAAAVFGLAWCLQSWRGGTPGPGGASAWALGADAPLLLLSLLALHRSRGVRWTAQFAIVPLIVLLEGLLMARPIMDWRTDTGLGLLLVASIALLLPPQDEESPPWFPEVSNYKKHAGR